MIGAFLVVVLSYVGLLEPLKHFAEDQRFRIVTRPATGRLLLLDIDEASIQALKVWPWSRTVHAAIIDKLLALGAADIAFDVDFSSTSTEEGDAALQAALERAGGGVVLAAFQQFARAGSTTALMQSRPLARFADHALEGSVNVWPDPDGRVRWFTRGAAFGGAMLPSLATILGSRSGRTDGRYLIDYGIDGHALAHASVSDLLNGSLGDAQVRDRQVIVGATAVELRDLFEAPRFGLIPGAAVQALAVESLLQGRELEPIGVSATSALATLLLAGLCFAGRRASLGGFVALCAGAAGAAELGALLLQAAEPVVLDTAPVHAGALALAITAAMQEFADRRRKLLRSRRNANRLRVMLDRVVADNFAGIVVVDQDGRIRAASEAASSILGTPVGAASPCAFADQLPPALARLLAAAMDAHARRAAALTGDDPPEACEVEIERAGRTPILLSCVTTVSPIVGEHGQDAAADIAICLTFRDITEERRAQAKLEHMARTDALTGLVNRSVFLAAVESRRAQRTDACAAVMIFDVDRFKLVNDRLGHASGDALIHAIADRLRFLVGSGDVVARLGGDEFALVAERPARADVQDLAEAIQHGLCGVYEIGSFQPVVAVSLGLAFLEGQETTELMTCADAALYAAKSAGGCVRVYDAAMKAAAAEGKDLAHDLRLALDRGEFRVVYQRQVDARTEQIVGVEALVRWHHPERGRVSPAAFIPIAERTGLIEPIGAWVLETACRDALSWPAPIAVSVNLSAVQLARATFADMVLAVLAETGLPPGRLDLELTESLLLENDGLVRTTIERLRAVGVNISLDDFGTGYSSLSYLNAFAIDKIKIDQSFVRDLVTSSSCVAIVRAVVSLAQTLGLRVNVEGVETMEQFVLLQHLQCDEIQGFLHGPPEPSSAIAASLLGQMSGHAAHVHAA